MILCVSEKNERLKNKHGILVEHKISEKDTEKMLMNLSTFAKNKSTQIYCAVMPPEYSMEDETTFNIGYEYPIDHNLTDDERWHRYYRIFQASIYRIEGTAKLDNFYDIVALLKEVEDILRELNLIMYKYRPVGIWYDVKSRDIVIEVPYDKAEKYIMSDEELYDVRTKSELFRYAYYDTLTGMHNWNWMWEKLDLHKNEGIDEYAFIHFDVKDFKLINNIYGHEEGDNLLRRVANAIEDCEWVYHSCRCHNDNFAIMGRMMSKEEYIEKLLELFEKVGTLHCDHNYHVYYRCGIVLLSNAYRVPEDKIADLAKAAQRIGRDTSENQITFYDDSMHNNEIYRSILKAELQNAIDNDEFVVYFQPKYDARTEEIIGAEALVRWNYHHKELWHPAKFIPHLERDGLVSKIDQVVFIKVCEFIKYCIQNNIPLKPVSVNFSRVGLFNDNFVNEIRQVVAKESVDPAHIDIELTETAAYDDNVNLLKVMKELKEIGFKISLDDFGTGFSALGLLKDMPIDTLKIDKSFVDGIVDNSDRENWLVKDIIQIAKHMDIVCLAEGAEKKEQVELLRNWGCEYIQGFYYSKPVPMNEYINLLTKSK